MRAVVVAALVALPGLAAGQFTAPPECMNGVDDDLDGVTDYSVTPGEEDPGCDAWNDDSEAELSVAAPIRPRLAIVFDTSGSMMWNVCAGDGDGYTGGDGSAECRGDDVTCCNDPPGEPMECTFQDRCDSSSCENGLADDARLYKVKRGLSDAVAAYGEIEYSLYRFHAEAVDFAGCPAVSNGSQPVGGWQGATQAPECVGADRLVKFAPENQGVLLQWMDNDSNWDGAGDPPLVDAAAGISMDLELRGSGLTPLGESLDQVGADLALIRADDPVASCRPYSVVLVTDGQETCASGSEVAAAMALRDADVAVYVIGFAGNEADFVGDMRAIAAAGGTGEPYFVDDSDSLSAALADIAAKTVLVETCNGLDDDCDGVADNGFQKGTCNNGQRGACFRIGFYECVSETETACSAPTVVPPAEEPAGCNGIDDDCDGLVDDGLTCTGCRSEICNGIDDDCNDLVDDGVLPGVGDPCGLAEGACEPGVLACAAGRLECAGATGPSPEQCDGLDNNCDGAVDGLIRACYDFSAGCIDTDPSPTRASYQCLGLCRAGTQSCTTATQPQYGACANQLGPTEERCNGEDDDCDGRVDDGFDELGASCMRGVGLCRSTGKFVCSADGTQLVCDAPVVTGVPEVCNGVDDDCNARIDDLPTPPPAPIGEPCGTCGGTFACRAGAGLVCEGGDATAEVCNGLDDDCNDIVDDGPLPGVGDACVPEVDGQPAFMLTGECRAGHEECIEGDLECVGALGPQAEVCNGRDDDCDGNVDDMAACPAPTDTCYQGGCVSPCAEGEFPCPFGLYCLALPPGSQRFCVPDPCAGVTCTDGEVCDRDDGVCKDPCEGVTCTDGRECRLGQCVDCFSTGCASGMVCAENGAGVGACQPDPCAGIDCPVGQACVAGACGPTACPDGCDAGERCQAGACVAACSLDVCSGRTCPAGTACNPQNGRCVADPCARADCGDLSCSLSCEGRAFCATRPSVDVVATGGGGFQCEIGAVSNGSPRALLVLALFAALLVASRRRT